MNRILGMILIGVGLLGLMWRDFGYTTREKIVDLGPMDVFRDIKPAIGW